MEKDHVSSIKGIVLIGASAGGLEVIFNMLQRLPVLNIPLLIILHRKVSIESTLTKVMSLRSELTVKEAEEKEPLQNGTIYIAPADYHLLIESDWTFSLDSSEKVNYSRPSIDVTFESAAQIFGRKCVGILLSGGNADGVGGLRAIKEAGGICCVQDPSTAEIAFMPEKALEMMDIDRILKPEEIADFIGSLQ